MRGQNEMRNLLWKQCVSAPTDRIEVFPSMDVGALDGGMGLFRLVAPGVHADQPAVEVSQVIGRGHQINTGM